MHEKVFYIKYLPTVEEESTHKQFIHKSSRSDTFKWTNKILGLDGVSFQTGSVITHYIGQPMEKLLRHSSLDQLTLYY